MSVMRGNLRMALAGVKNAKWRSLLTMLGVIIGVVSVVTVVGIGEGMKRQVAGAIDHFGKDLITVRPGQVEPGLLQKPGDTNAVFGLQYTGGFTVRDVDVLRQIPEVKMIAPLGVIPGIVQADEQQLRGGTVIATSASLPEAINQEVAFGAFWESKDEDAQMAVIGSDAADTLFQEAVPLGRSFTFHGETFVVRGIFAEFNSMPLSPTAEFDDAIFIPYKTAERLTDNTAQLYALLAKPHDPKMVDETVFAITEQLKEQRGGQQDFSVLNREQNVAASDDVLGLLATWIMAVAVIALLIGGVGIMNIMLVSVTERMHEIGVRKAIGATNRQILTQFALEAVVLSVVGGIIGVVASLASIGLLRVYTDFEPIISWKAVAIATGVSLAVGIIFGSAPAIKAARKDPIDALRHE